MNDALNKAPCKYDFGWNNNPPGIILNIHQTWIRNVSCIPTNLLMIEIMKENFPGLGNFSNSFDETGKEPFGFGGAFQNQGLQTTKSGDIFLQFFSPLPLIRHDKGECPDCHGTGEDEDSPSGCWKCFKQGRLFEYVALPAYNIIASLHVFLNYASLPDYKSDATLKQLITLENGAEQSRNGCWISGLYCSEVINFLASLCTDQKKHRDFEQGLKQTMQVAWIALQGSLHHASPHAFDCHLLPGGRFHLDLPGDGCYLYSNLRNGDGEISTHNVDRVTQQLAFFSALMTINQLAREHLSA